MQDTNIHPINKFIARKKLSLTDLMQIWDDAYGFMNGKGGTAEIGGIGHLTTDGANDYADGWRDEIIAWYRECMPEVIK